MSVRLSCAQKKKVFDSRVIGSSVSTTKNDMDILVTVGLDNGSVSILGDSNKAMSMLGTSHGINRHTRGSIGSILESDRETSTRCQLSVKLGFSGSGTNGSPRDEVRDELRRNGVEKF